jgi:carbon monoxide dehydrogenase subunit G
MKVERTQRLPFARAQVWDKLMDFAVLERTLPGVEALEPLGEDACRLTIKVLVPSVTGTYDGTVTVVEKRPPEGYRLRGEAKGRLGWVRGDALFELREQDAGTEVVSTMDFQTGGPLAGVGQRFMEGIARGMLREFMESFEKELQR